MPWSENVIKKISANSSAEEAQMFFAGVGAHKVVLQEEPRKSEFVWHHYGPGFTIWYSRIDPALTGEVQENDMWLAMSDEDYEFTKRLYLVYAETFGIGKLVQDG